MEMQYALLQLIYTLDKHYHRITKCSGLEGTSVGHLVQPLCQSRVTCSRLHRTLTRQVLNISRGGDSTTSLGSLFQCSVTLRGKKFFLMFRRKFLCFSLCPLPLVLSLGTTKRVWPHPLDTHPSDIYKHLLHPLFFRLEQAQLPQSFLIGKAPIPTAFS